MSELRKEFKLPVVYKPSIHIRELRKLFSQYQMITEQIGQHKNSIQAVFVENGIHYKFKASGYLKPIIVVAKGE